MNQTLLAYDCSAFLWRALQAGKDPEGFEAEGEDGRPTWVNCAPYGYENVMSLMLKAMRDADVQPIDCILVFEGMNSKARRLGIDKEYKGQRGKRAPQAYDEFHKLRKQIEAVWHSIGAMCCYQHYVEGDDVLAWFAKYTRRNLVIATYDNDLAALNTEPGETNEHGATVTTWIDGQLGVNKYGVWPYRLITTYKALMGDDSDNYKGVIGFGPKTFEKFLEDFGFDGFEELQDMLETGELSPALHAMALEVHEKGPKKGKPIYPHVAMICDQEANLLRCYRLARLRPEWVHNNKDQIVFQPGIVLPPPENVDERIAQYHQSKYLIGAAEFDDAIEHLCEHLPKSPFVAFDIETSSADESDEWLAAQGDPDGVDQIGSTLTGFSLTFGKNLNETIYVSVDHAQTSNITREQVLQLIDMIPDHLDTICHNAAFELSVLYENGFRFHEKDSDERSYLRPVEGVGAS